MALQNVAAPWTVDGEETGPGLGVKVWLQLERAAIEFGARLEAEADHTIKRAPGGQLGVARAPDRKSPPHIRRIK